MKQYRQILDWPQDCKPTVLRALCWGPMVCSPGTVWKTSPIGSQPSVPVDGTTMEGGVYQVAIVRQKKTPIHIRVRRCASDMLFIDHGLVGSDRSQA